MDKIYWDILDQKRSRILPLLVDFKNDFYLAGGTALALQLGHRDSVDFDFFCQNSFSTNELYKKIEKTFSSCQLIKVQEAKDTLTLMVDTNIKLSFLGYRYKLIRPLKEEKYLKIASIEDIGCMKMSAIISRSVFKDYVDLYFILHHFNLATLLNLAKKKFPTIDSNLVLKSLVYFDDIEIESIIFKHDQEISFEIVKTYLLKTVKKYLDLNK